MRKSTNTFVSPCILLHYDGCLCLSGISNRIKSNRYSTIGCHNWSLYIRLLELFYVMLLMNIHLGIINMHSISLNETNRAIHRMTNRKYHIAAKCLHQLGIFILITFDSDIKFFVKRICRSYFENNGRFYRKTRQMHRNRLFHERWSFSSARDLLNGRMSWIVQYQFRIVYWGNYER